MERTLSPKGLETFDYDDIRAWGPTLNTVLAPRLPTDIASIIRAGAPKYVEDARTILFSHAERAVLAELAEQWIVGRPVFGYHGTRLTPSEQESVKSLGLKPLVASDREARLRRSLSSHPRWTEVEPNLKTALDYVGSHREGQVHLTLSRAGLVEGFNHYLRQGSEFDWHVAHHLLGEEGQDLIATDGTAFLLRVRVPGDKAFAACNPWGPKTNGDLANLIHEIFQIWPYWLAHPECSSADLQIDCGLVFRQTIPPGWIEAIDPL